MAAGQSILRIAECILFFEKACDIVVFRENLLSYSLSPVRREAGGQKEEMWHEQV